MIRFIGIILIVILIGCDITTYSENKMPDNLKEFIALAENYPEEYSIVIGKYANLAERLEAAKLHEQFNIKIIEESSVKKRTQLILIGTPYTNLLLDKFLVKPYNPGRPEIIVQKSNLLIMFSNEFQAEELRLTYSGKSYFELGSPIRQSLVYTILGFIALLPFIFFIFEHSRKQKIPIESELTSYIKKYTEQGYSDDQMIDWLTKQGFEEEEIMGVFNNRDNA